MPNIIITEKDYTSAEAIAYNDYVVLIPGDAETDKPESDEDKIKVFSTVEEFVDIVGETSSLANKMAIRLLSLGMKVLYVVTASSELTKWSFWEQFTDKGKYDIRFITSGLASDSSSEISAAGIGGTAELMIKCAATRGDAIALVNCPITSTTTTQDIEDFFAGIADQTIVRDVDDASKNETANKYGAGFATQFAIKNDKDSEGGTHTINYPGSFGYLSCFSKFIGTYSSWYAMAGSVRGQIPFTDVKTVNKLGDADIAIIQNRKTVGHQASNAICEIRPYGNVVWGNRTIHPITQNPETGTSGLTASSFLNIRNLCCDIKKTVYRACRKFTFEPNSDTLWVRFCNEITPLLEEMKANQGIKGYKIVKVATGIKATLAAKVIITPIEAVEDFDIGVDLTDSIVITE